jgi:hypothetical protein
MSVNYISGPNNNLLLISDKEIPGLEDRKETIETLAGLLTSFLRNEAIRKTFVYSIPNEVIEYAKESQTLEELTDYFKGVISIDSLPQHLRLLLMLN